MSGRGSVRAERAHELLGCISACLAAWLCSPALLAAPRTFRIADFSPDFYATVTVDDESLGEVFREGSVSVFDAVSKQELVSVSADELSFDAPSGVAPANVAELPYGTQSLVLFQDFDFDGLPDLALMDGQKSCYHGPSYRIYLQKKGHRLVASPAFTELAQSYCGMFQVDAAARRLRTMAKNGCCMHVYDTYSVVNHVPHVVESVVESMLADAPAYMQLERTGRPTIFALNSLADGLTTPVVEFELAGDKKRRVAVFVTEGVLDYALAVGDEQRVEFSYYLDVLRRRTGNVPAKLPPFRFDAAKGELSFANGPYRYVICDAPGRLGIEVRQGRHVTFLAGNAQTRSGGLERLGSHLPTNVEPVTP
jgi:hypothetical protein